MTLEMDRDSATRVWDELTDCLERFQAAWQRGAEPRIGAFVPAEPAVLRHLVMCELVKVDMELRCGRGIPSRLEDYIASYPELLEDGEPPCDLLYEEYQLRRRRGEAVTPSEYLRRFPRRAPQLARLLETPEPEATTAMTRQCCVEQLAAGQTVDDFQLLVSLGRGAFAQVFLARQLSLHRLVALKVSSDKGTEPQTLAQLDHPHIVRVYDQRVLPDKNMRLLYMQYVPGGTLHEVVHAARQMPPDARSGKLILQCVDEAIMQCGAAAAADGPQRRRLQTARWSETVCILGSQLAQALDYAHHMGILHRDIKPANVLLSADGSPKLADFNISFSSVLQGATASSYFGGSLTYMSPEQIEASDPAHERRPESLDGRSDLYSLAVVLWELLHGERPFRDERLEGGWSATLQHMAQRRHSHELSTPPDATDDEVARRLRRVLRRVLHPDPDCRPATGAELARELALCVQPGAWQLLVEPARGLARLARRWPLITLLLVIFPPNALAAAFNYWYNKSNIIDPLGPAARQVFHYVQLTINGTAFPVGVLILAWLVWPLRRALRQLREGIAGQIALAPLRRRVLRLGDYAALVGLTEWLIAGLAFPLGIHLGLGSFPTSGYGHFLASMLICGAVAAAFPFMGCAWLAVRVFYPALLIRTEPLLDESNELAALARRAGLYLLVAGGVPLLGLLLLLSSGVEHRAASLALVLAGVAGLAVAYVAHGTIRSHVASLLAAARPVEAIGVASESLDNWHN